MKNRVALGICLLGGLLFVISYQLGNVLALGPCNEYCKEYTHFCKTDANKKCTANQCFFYHTGPDITNYANNCWPCGDGPGKGRCQNGNASKECKPTKEAVNWQFTASCDPECDPSFANTYIEATAGGLIVGTGNGVRYECVLKGSK